MRQQRRNYTEGNDYEHNNTEHSKHGTQLVGWLPELLQRGTLDAHEPGR